MSSNNLDIPGRKETKISASSDDDDHSFIILGSSAANSLSSYDHEIEFISEAAPSPILEGATVLDDTDLETLINSELGDNDNDFNSIPDICESLMATIRPGMVISLNDNYTNVLRENLEEILMRFKQLTGMTCVYMGKNFGQIFERLFCYRASAFDERFAEFTVESQT